MSMNVTATFHADVAPFIQNLQMASRALTQLGAQAQQVMTQFQQAQSALTGASAGVTGAATSASADVTQMGQAAADAGQQMQLFTHQVGDASTQTAQATMTMNELGRSLQTVKGIAAVAFAAAGVATIGFGMQAFHAAARVEELDVAMQAIGKSTGVGAQAIQDATQAIRDNGIELAAAQSIAIEFAQNNLEMGQAADIARVAQDLAVIAARNSTEVTQILTQAIITGNSQLLKSAGINKYASEAYTAMAASLGKNVSALTASERQQAVANMVLEEGAKVAGTYEASMTSAGKVLRSFKRIMNDIQIEVGGVLTKAFSPLILAVYELFKAFSKMLREGGQLHGLLVVLGNVAREMFEPLTRLADAATAALAPMTKQVTKVREAAGGAQEHMARLDHVVQQASRSFEDVYNDELERLKKDATAAEGGMAALQKQAQKVAAQTTGFQKLYDNIRTMVPPILAAAAAMGGFLRFLPIVGQYLGFLNPFTAFLITMAGSLRLVREELRETGSGFGEVLSVVKEFITQVAVGLRAAFEVINAVFAEVILQANKFFGGLINAAGGAKTLKDNLQVVAPIVASLTVAFVAYRTALMAVTIAKAAQAAMTGVMMFAYSRLVAIGVVAAAQQVYMALVTGLSTAAMATQQVAALLLTGTLALLRTGMILGAAVTAGLTVVIGTLSVAMRALRVVLIAVRGAMMLLYSTGLLPITLFAALGVAAFLLAKKLFNMVKGTNMSMDEFALVVVERLEQIILAAQEWGDSFSQGVANILSAIVRNASAFAENFQNFFIASFEKIIQAANKVGEGLKAVGILRDFTPFNAELERVSYGLRNVQYEAVQFAKVDFTRIKDFIKDRKPFEMALGYLKEMFNLKPPEGGEDPMGVKKIGKGAEEAKRKIEEMFQVFRDALKSATDAVLELQGLLRTSLFPGDPVTFESQLVKMFGADQSIEQIVASYDRLTGIVNQGYNSLIVAAQAGGGKLAKAQERSLTGQRDRALEFLNQRTSAILSAMQTRQRLMDDMKLLEDQYVKKVEAINTKYDAMEKALKAQRKATAKHYDNMIRQAEADLRNTERYYDGLVKAAEQALEGTRSRHEATIRTLENVLADVSKTFERENAVLQRLIDERKAFTDRISQDFRGFANDLRVEGRRAERAIMVMTNRISERLTVTVQREVEFGGGAGSFRKALEERLQTIREFAANVRTLMARGLDPRLLKDFVQQGVQGAGQVVAQLAKGDPADIAAINSLQSQLSEEVASFSASASAEWYDAGVAQQEAIVGPARTAMEVAQQNLANAQLLRDQEVLAAELHVEAMRLLRDREVENARQRLESLREMKERELEMLDERAEELKELRDKELKDAQEAHEKAMKALQDLVDGQTLLIKGYAMEIEERFRALGMTLGGKGPSSVYAIGKKASKGFLDGLRSRDEEIMAWARGIAEAIRRELRSALDLRSPSRVMMRIGEQVAAGLALGLERGTSRIEDAVRGMNRPLGSLSAPVGGATGGAVTNITIEVNAGMGADGAMVGEEIVRALTTYERRNGPVYVRAA